MQKQPRANRRSKTIAGEYQRKKNQLSLMKPRYMRENMSGQIHSFTAKSINQQHHSLLNGNIKNEAQFLKERIQKMKNQLVSFQRIYDANKMQAIRYRYKDLMQRQINRKNTAQNLQNVDLDSPDKDETMKPYFPLIRRRKRKSTKYIKETQVDEPAHEQSIIQKRYYNSRPLQYFMPSSLQREELTIKKAIIKRQIINKPKVKSVNFQKNMSSLKKCFNVVLFITFIRRYSRLYRKSRKNYLTILDNDGIIDKFIDLKKYFMEGCKTFFEVVVQKYNVSYEILETDSNEVRQNKITCLNAFLKLLLKCIRQSIYEMQSRDYQTDIIYSICKHGSYGSMWKFHSSQQLALCSISEQEGYIRADSYLQKSAIITLIFIKIIIFNILMQPHTVNLKINPLLERSKLVSNLRIIGNIFYELMITDQDQLLDKCDQSYIISNWAGLLHKYKIEPAASLTVKEGVISKFEVISGLMDHTLIRKRYKIDRMSKEKQIIQEMVQVIYQNIRKYHQKYRKSFI